MINILTQNVRGLRDKNTRQAVFRHLHRYYSDHLVVLQETHSSPLDEISWSNEWGTKIYFSHGSSHQAGTAILLPLRFNATVDEIAKDKEGRIVAVRLTHGRESTTIIGVYAPSVDIQARKIEFIDQLRNTLVEISDVYTIVAGDFNIHLSPLDVEPGKFKHTRARHALSNLIEEFFLTDMWRSQNPDKREFTWRRTTPISQSRIDYIFVNEAFRRSHQINSNISAGILTDHSAVSIKAVNIAVQRGPGLWKYNNDLHESDKEFRDFVKTEIIRFKRGDKYKSSEPIGLRMELLLSSVREMSIRRGKQIAYDKKKEERNLSDQISAWEKDLAKLTSNELNTYRQHRQRLDDLKMEKGYHSIVSSGADWIEWGEKTTRYFLNRGKQLSAQKSIDELNVNGKIITDKTQILEYCASYYTKVYSSKGIDRAKAYQFLQHSNIPKLSEAERATCDGPISNEECRLALSQMNKRKTPGITGFTVDFFSFFWNEIGDIIVEYINDANNNGFFITHRRGVITLIPKKGDTKSLENRRPICLLDVIYKIVAKVISMRLDFVIRKLIKPEQTGFIKGRFIGENLRLTSDVIEYCNTDNIEGLAIACDFRSAFDSLEHEFIFESLKAYNFGNSFIQWVKLLYRESYLSVINNGYTSPWFKCTRGTFQGAGHSGLIFILALEILAIHIRESAEISGIEISSIHIKLSLFADDLLVFCKDQKSAEKTIDIIKEFSKASGLSLNEAKSKLMWLGPLKHKRTPVCGIEAHDKIKSLGIYFSACSSCVADNVEPITHKIENVMKVWRQRTLTLKGRITVSKSLIASQLVYLCSCIKIPKHSIRTIQSNIMRFLWRGRPPKVSKSTLVQEISDGGLKAVDVELFCKSLHMTWLRRIHLCREALWRKLLQARIGKYDLSDMIGTALGRDEIKRMKIPSFYLDVLLEFQNFICTPLDSTVDIQKEMLWFNKSIRTNGKTWFINGMYRAGIKFIDDLLSHRGHIMSLSELKIAFPEVRVNFLTYMRLIRSIPQMWKDKILSGHFQKLSTDDKANSRECKLGTKILKIDELCSSHFYQSWINNSVPAAVLNWESKGYHMDWGKVFQLPYRCTISTRLQTLHYRIVHRFLPTNRFLFTRRVIDNPLCSFCNQIDSLEHFIYECVTVRHIWQKIFQTLHIQCADQAQACIFGIIGATDADNTTILLMKQYITTSKLSNPPSTISYEGAIAAIIHHIVMENRIAIRNNDEEKFLRKWGHTISRIQF